MQNLPANREIKVSKHFVVTSLGNFAKLSTLFVVSLAKLPSGMTSVMRLRLKASAADIFLLNRSSSLALAVPISLGKVYEEHPSGDWPRAENGVWNVAYKEEKY